MNTQVFSPNVNHNVSLTELFLRRMFRNILAAISLTVVLLWSPLLMFADVPASTNDQAAPSELYTLDNADLLEQAQNMYQKASGAFLTEMRGVQTNKTLFDQIRQEIGAVTIPQESPPEADDDALPLDVAQQALEYAKKRHEALERKLQLAQSENALLDNYLAQLETGQVAAENFINVIEQLARFLLEIDLRVKDGTLKMSAVPDALNSERLRQQHRQLTAQYDELHWKMELAEQKLPQAAEQVETMKKAVIEATARVFSAEENYAQELTRHTLEEEYAEQTPDSLLAQITNVQEELVWLRGAFNLTRGRFNRAQTQVGRIQQNLDSLTLPEKAHAILQLQPNVRAEEAEQMITAAEEITEYYAGRLEILRQLRSALQSLLTHGETFQGDMAVLREHLFRMQVFANVLETSSERGDIDKERIPDEMRTEPLTVSGETVSRHFSDALAAIQETKEQLVRVDEESEHVWAVRKETETRVAQLKKPMNRPRSRGNGPRNSQLKPPSRLFRIFRRPKILFSSNRTNYRRFSTM